jgi:hypothetical protein
VVLTTTRTPCTARCCVRTTKPRQVALWTSASARGVKKTMDERPLVMIMIMQRTAAVMVGRKERKDGGRIGGLIGF